MKASALHQRIVKDLEALQEKIAADEVLLRGLLKVLARGKKREADRFKQLIDRVDSNMELLAAMVPQEKRPRPMHIGSTLKEVGENADALLAAAVGRREVEK